MLATALQVNYCEMRCRSLGVGLKVRRSHPRAAADEYAGRGHTKNSGPPIAQGGENGKQYRTDRAPPL
jgi:hypothetical protein